MISADLSLRPRWGRALLIAGGIHGIAIGTLFVRFSTTADPSLEMPAIAVEMATPTAPPAPVHDTPTPRQVEAPKQTPQQKPQPIRLPFDVPPQQVADAKPEVVLPPKKDEQPKVETANPLPPAPATTEQAAPDLKPDTKVAAAVTGGVAAGKATPADLWDARVRSRIEMTKRYPGAAARQNQQDNVDVVLTLDRTGRLLDAQVRASAGFALLNDAALEAVRRAAPFPKPPAEIAGDPLKLSVIVRFFRRDARR